MFWDPNARVVPARNQAEGWWCGRCSNRRRPTTLSGPRDDIGHQHFHRRAADQQIQQLRARIRPVLAEINPGQAASTIRQSPICVSAVVQRAKRVQDILGEPEPEPLRFTSSGEGQLVKWQPSIRAAPAGSSGKRTPTAANCCTSRPREGGRCTASWRTRVLLPGGRYVFSARIRTAGVVALTKDVISKGVGAGIRQSQHQVRKHGLVGDNEWQTVEYEFEIPGESGDAALLCELRAEQGKRGSSLAPLSPRKNNPNSPPRTLPALCHCA
jgi:hypothetical protein